MLNKKLSGLLLSGLLSFGFVPAFSQDAAAPREKALVMYDPLFWKHDLKLSSDQCQKIKEINYEFFQRFNSLSTENKVVVPAKAAALLTDRSEKIWSTFQPRQKKKWLKLWATES